jgi:hypothetical protein
LVANLAAETAGEKAVKKGAMKAVRTGLRLAVDWAGMRG